MYKLLFFIAYFTLITFPSSGEITRKIEESNPAAPFTDVKNLTSDLELINNAMNSTIHIEGRFVQYAPDGSIMAGNLFINRPGKLRIEYDSPNSFLIISDGVSLIQKTKI
jgi:outer membrane lipoprotein-sorting protein